jgi:hypothetical protein
LAYYEQENGAKTYRFAGCRRSEDYSESDNDSEGLADAEPASGIQDGAGSAEPGAVIAAAAVLMAREEEEDEEFDTGNSILGDSTGRRIAGYLKTESARIMRATQIERDEAAEVEDLVKFRTVNFAVLGTLRSVARPGRSVHKQATTKVQQNQPSNLLDAFFSNSFSKSPKEVATISKTVHAIMGDRATRNNRVNVRLRRWMGRAGVERLLAPASQDTTQLGLVLAMPLRTEQWCLMLCVPRGARLGLTASICIARVVTLSYKKNGGRGPGQFCSELAVADVDTLCHIGAQLFGYSGPEEFSTFVPATETGFSAFASMLPKNILKVVPVAASAQWSLHKRCGFITRVAQVDDATMRCYQQLKLKKDELVQQLKSRDQFSNVSLHV